VQKLLISQDLQIYTAEINKQAKI